MTLVRGPRTGYPCARDTFSVVQSDRYVLVALDGLMADSRLTLAGVFAGDGTEVQP